MTRVKIVQIELQFEEESFHLDKITEEYVMGVLKHKHIITHGVSAKILASGIIEV